MLEFFIKVSPLFWLSCIAATLLVMWLWLYRHTHDGDWHETNDGKNRRWTGSGWEYRDMTHDECESDRANRSW